jgi:hypothetical protein
MRPNTLRTLRRYHQYVGMFFAPWILLFAVSGALQTFRLPDPPAAPLWMKWLAAVHKDQAPPREPRAERKDAGPRAGDHRRGDQTAAGGAKRPNPLPLKIFVVLLAIALALSTIIGVVIGLANRAMRRGSIVLLVLGTVIPPVLLWL